MYRFHRCIDSGEAYAASYITTKEHLLEHFTDYNLVYFYFTLLLLLTTMNYMSTSVIFYKHVLILVFFFFCFPSNFLYF